MIGTHYDLSAVVCTRSARCLAVGENGVGLLSTKDRWWLSRVSPLDINDVIWNGKQFVAIGAGFVSTSSDGINGELLVNLKPLGLFAAVGFSGRIETSPDGLVWTPASPGLTNLDLRRVTWTGDRFVAVGSSGVIVGSSDGVTWVLESFGASIDHVVWARDGFFAFGFDQVWRSPNGRDWTQYGMIRIWEDLAWSGERYAISGYDLGWSSDGVNWMPAHLGGFVTCDGITWAGAQFVAVCRGGYARRSVDGAVWNSSKIGDGSDDWTDVVWTGSRLVAIGSAGNVATSPDGVTWSIGSSPAGYRRSTSIAWSGQRLVAVGYFGWSMNSQDGIVWTSAETGTVNHLSGVTWAGDHFVAVGNAGTILVSTDGVSWSPSASPAGEFSPLNGVAAGAGRVVVVGEPGLIMTF